MWTLRACIPKHKLLIVIDLLKYACGSMLNLLVVHFE